MFPPSLADVYISKEIITMQQGRSAVLVFSNETKPRTLNAIESILLNGYQTRLNDAWREYDAQQSVQPT